MYQTVHSRAVTDDRTTARDDLLARAIEAVRAHGWSTLSLRRLAELIGTSHRMLIYHFGSKEGLLTAIVQASEAADRAASGVGPPATAMRPGGATPGGSAGPETERPGQAGAEPRSGQAGAEPRSGQAGAEPRPGLAAAEQLRANWAHLADPSLAAQERLFFELYAQGLQGVEPAAGLLPGLVTDWLALAPPGGEPAVRATLALVRGLLLDLLATGDREGCDAALEWFARRLALRERSGGDPSTP
jgi:AcrR family transcriptional regulator